MIFRKKLFTLILTFGIGLGVLPSVSLFAQSKPQQNTQAQQEHITVTEFDKKSILVQENFKTMQEQMEVIRVTKDPQERLKLIEEYWTTIRTNKDLIDGIWGQGMMGGAFYSMREGGHMMVWGDAGRNYSNLNRKELKQRQYMTDQYIGMQQKMMSHMMQQNPMMIYPCR
jgi:hypothetical protein